jgi:hypothetical protein
MPVLETELSSAFSAHIHPILLSSSTGLVPQTYHGMIQALDKEQGHGSIPPHTPHGQHTPHSLHHPHEDPTHPRGAQSPMFDNSSAHSLHSLHSGMESPGAPGGHTPSRASSPSRGSTAGISVHTKKETIRRRSLGKDAAPQMKPLSATACEIVMSTFREGFASCEGVANTDEQARHCIVSVGKTLDALLLKSIKRTSDELDDIVCYGDIACKDWMASNTLW